MSMYFLPRWWKTQLGISLSMGLLLVVGCSTVSEPRPTVKGPIINDNLKKPKTVAGIADGGTFTKKGWQPGKEGTLTYELPGMPQGVVEVDLQGLDRTGQSTVLLTLFEPGYGKYADPYILLNPYRVTVSVLNFQEFPQSAMELLWTIKSFSNGTDPLQRYVQGIPQGVEGFEKSEKSGYTPVYPYEKYMLRLEWRHGLVQLYLNKTLMVKQEYHPLLYNPKSLKLVLGKSPGLATFDQPNLTISAVRVFFPAL